MLSFKFLLFIVATLPFAYSGARKGEGRWRFYSSFALSYFTLFFGVFVPILYFVFSLALAPVSQTEAIFPLSPLMETKVWVAPFAIWAWLSFYFSEVLGKKGTAITLGTITGFIGSTLCSLGLLLIRDNLFDPMSGAMLLLLPVVYTPVWYAVGAFRAYRNHPVRIYHLCVTVLSQALGWLWASKQALEVYDSLPVTVSDKCYVVSASAYGYAPIVRPMLRFDNEQGIVRESQQLIRLRAFEALWCDSAPRTHSYFRFIYNRVGPLMARLIRPTPIATIAYLTLKPAEYLAVFLMRVCGNRSHEV